MRVLRLPTHFLAKILCCSAMLTSSLFRSSKTVLSVSGSAVRAASNYVVLGDAAKFKDIIAGDGNKILYFTATWCPPCKKIAPVFEKISKEFTNTTFVKIDIDDFRELAEEYRISSVPTFKAFKGTTKVSEFSGADESSLRRTAELLQK